MCRRLRGYRKVIKTADQHLAQWAEQENVFPTVLPYAIAFGLTTKWIKAFEGLQEDPTTSPTMSWWVPSGAGSIQIVLRARSIRVHHGDRCGDGRWLERQRGRRCRRRRRRGRRGIVVRGRNGSP